MTLKKNNKNVKHDTSNSKEKVVISTPKIFRKACQIKM